MINRKYHLMSHRRRWKEHKKQHKDNQSQKYKSYASKHWEHWGHKTTKRRKKQENIPETTSPEDTSQEIKQPETTNERNTPEKQKSNATLWGKLEYITWMPKTENGNVTWKTAPGKMKNRQTSQNIKRMHTETYGNL